MAKKQKPTFGVAFWIGLILLAAAVYLAYKIDFPTLLAKSGIPEAVKKSFGGDYRASPDGKPEKPASQEVPAAPEQPNKIAPAVPAPAVSEAKESPAKPPQVQQNQTVNPTVKERETPAAKPVQPQAQQNQEKSKPPAPKPAAKAPEEAPKYRDARLYFVRLSDDGKVQLVPVPRRVLAVTSPLTDLLDELLAGPRPDEKRSGLVSLVPLGTKLFSAVVKEDVAYLNFNDAFRFNGYGMEGLTGQLKQLVFSVTEIGQVRRVQILIEGKQLDYLSPEGGYIGKPLGKENF